MKKQSKFLALILRHKPDVVGLTLGLSGWVNISDLLAALKKHGRAMTRTELDKLVETNDKQRFAYNASRSKIRARQGHSVDVDLGYIAIQPPGTLYHGTQDHNIANIFADGICKMRRQHVHLSTDTKTAQKVAERGGGTPRIITLNAKQMFEDGLVFYKSDNNVWLVEHVPSSYIKVMY